MPNVLMGTQPPTPVVTGIPQITQIMIPSGTVHQNHLEKGSSIIKFGVAADRPTSGDVYPVFVSRDTGVMSIWNGTAWKTATFS